MGLMIHWRPSGGILPSARRAQSAGV